MAMTLAQGMWPVIGILALAALHILFFLTFGRKMSNRALLSSGAFGLLLGYVLLLIMPDSATVTKAYSYNIHTDWTWIFCTPIVVGGSLVALWMWLRWQPQIAPKPLQSQYVALPKRTNLPAIRKDAE
jgi:hypothetical protein